MGILASLLGPTNPLAQWTLQNHGLLSSWGQGLASGPTLEQGLSNAVQQGPAGQLIDQQYQKDAQDKADRENKIKQSSADLAKWPDLVKYVTDTGDTKGAFMEAFNRSAPGYGDPNWGKAPTDPTDSYAGRLQAGREQGLTGTDLGNYALTGKLPDNSTNLPTSYREFQLAQTDPEYAKRLNSSTSKPPTEQQIRAASLYTVVAPDAQSLLGDGAKKGIYDALTSGTDQALNGPNVFGWKPTAGFTSGDYQRAQNAVSNIAQSYLYATSGQSAPQGEVDKIVASVTPLPGENPQSVADKKRRLANYVQAIKNASQRGITDPSNDPSLSQDGGSTGDPDLDKLLTQYGGN